jgi:hypothetical protein
MRKTPDENSPYIGRDVRFKGIKVAAARLCITENHLRMVLKGVRTSKSLTARIRKQFPALLGERQ